jgi:hypothetical protein
VRVANVWCAGPGAKVNHVTHDRLLARYGKRYQEWRTIHDVLNANETLRVRLPDESAWANRKSHHQNE